MKQQKGQALAEWVVLSLAVITLWTCTLNLGQKLLAKTATNIWTVVAARASLSRAKITSPTRLYLEGKGSFTHAVAHATFEGSQAHYTIEIPSGKKESSLYNWSSFGSQFF